MKKTGTPIKIELEVIESEKNNFNNINLLIEDYQKHSKQNINPVAIYL